MEWGYQIATCISSRQVHHSTGFGSCHSWMRKGWSGPRSSTTTRKHMFAPTRWLRSFLCTYLKHGPEFDRSWMSELAFRHIPLPKPYLILKVTPDLSSCQKHISCFMKTWHTHIRRLRKLIFYINLATPVNKLNFLLFSKTSAVG